MPNTEKRSVFMDYIKNIGNKVGGFFDKSINAYNEQNSPENREKEIQRLQESNPNMDVEGFKKATEQTSEGKAIMDFGKMVLRAGPRAIGQVWNTLVGENNFTPSTPTQRLIYGAEPVDNTFNRIKTNQDIAKGFGYDPISSGAFGIVAGLAGTTFDILPGAGGVRKGVLEKTVGKIAASTSEKVIQKEASTLFRSYGVKLSEETLAKITPDLVGLTKPEEVKSYLNNFIKTGIDEATVSTAAKYSAEELNKMADYTDAVVAGTRAVDPVEESAIREIAMRGGIDPTIPQSDLIQQLKTELDKSYGMDIKANMTPEAIAHYKTLTDEVKSIGSMIDEGTLVGKDLEQGKARIQEISGQLELLGKETAMHSSPGEVMQTLLGTAGKTIEDTNKATRLADNLNNERFHGTSNNLEKLVNNEDMYSPNNIYGQGFYTTDSHNIAEGYAKKGTGTERNIYKIEEKSKVSMYNMEKPMDDDILKQVNDLTGHDYKKGDTLREVYDNIRELSASQEFSIDEAQDLMYGLEEIVSAKGFRGLEHTGGKLTGNAPHNVKIYWKPAEDLLHTKEIPNVTPQQIADLPSEQRALLDVPKVETVLSDDIKDAIKSDISQTGKISEQVAERVKDNLYGRNLIDDVEYAVTDASESFNKFKKTFSDLGREVPDDISRVYEQFLADRIISSIEKSGGKISKYIDKMKALGIRDDVINELKLGSENLTDVVKVKRIVDGEPVAMLTAKDVAEYEKIAKEKKFKKTRIDTATFKGKLKNAGSTVGDILRLSELPELFFDRIGLKKKFYSPVIDGVRKWEKERSIYAKAIYDLTKKMSKTDSEDVMKYLYSQQADTAEKMAEANMTAKTFDELSDSQKKLASFWYQIKSELEPRYIKAMERMGKPSDVIENYVHLMRKKSIKHVGEGADAASESKFFSNSPYFKSAQERVAGVPMSDYDLSFENVARDYVNDVTRAVNIEPATTEVASIARSDEFKKIFGKNISTKTLAWVDDVVSPNKQIPVNAKAIKALNNAQYVAYLGLNLKTAMKQALSLVPYYMVNGGLWGSGGFLRKNDPLANKLIKDGLPSLISRVPFIGMEGLSEKTKKYVLGTITIPDKLSYKKAVGGELTRLIEKARKNKLNLEEGEVLDDIVREAQDTIDRWFGGTLPGQRPEVYRTEVGKYFLPFTSTINSALQAGGREAKNTKGLGKRTLAITKLAASALSIGYLGQAINNLSWGEDDPIDTAKKTLRETVSNVPGVSGIIYALETGSYDMFMADNSIASAFKSFAEGDYGNAVWSIAEAAGTPKQIRKTIQGVEASPDLRHAIGGKNIDYGKGATGGSTSSSSGSFGSSYGGTTATPSGGSGAFGSKY